MKKSIFDEDNKLDCELFSNICIKDCFTLPKSLPEISKIISIVAEHEVLGIKTINSVQGTTFEGRYLSGKKAVFELKLKQKMLYTSKADPQSVHMAVNETFQCVYMVIPCNIEGTDPEYLLTNKFLKYEINIEEIEFEQLDKRSIYVSALIYIKLFLLPTYQLCYSLHKNCKSSSIYLANDAGTRNSLIQFNNKCKCIKPKWSPSGSEIAFLSDHGDKCALYIYSVRNGVTQRITDKLPNSISSFEWSSDGYSIFFTSSLDGCKEIFSVNIGNHNYRQLTWGRGIYNSFGPKCSWDKITFLRSISGISDVWSCNSDGTNLRKMTACGFVKCFDWLTEKALIIVKGNDGQFDDLIKINISNSKSKKIDIGDFINIKSVTISKDGNNIAFIGCDLYSENVYVYNLEEEKTTNLTNHQNGVKIGSVVWKTDSSMIYYSSNESFYFNIFAIKLKNMQNRQLTNSTAENIELSYRPRIG